MMASSLGLRRERGELKSVFPWSDPQAGSRIKMGPSGAGKSGFQGYSGIFTIRDKHYR
jgi:hypothetical protein